MYACYKNIKFMSYVTLPSYLSTLLMPLYRYMALCVWQFIDFSLRHMYSGLHWLGEVLYMYVVITMHLVHRALVIAMNTAALQSYFKTPLWYSDSPLALV